MSEPRTARSVSNVLKKAGINTGLKYTQAGYTQHDGTKATEPGVMVSRQKRARYGGMEDIGGVGVYLISDVTSGHFFNDRVGNDLSQAVEMALDVAGLPYSRNSVGDFFKVFDETPEQAVAQISDEELLKSFAVLTHRIHAARDKEQAREFSLRDERDLVQAEILRRMGQGR